MKAMFKKVHVGSKIKDSLGNVLTIKEKRDGELEIIQDDRSLAASMWNVRSNE